MRNNKQNPNIRAIKLWHLLCPTYFPLLIANAIFSNISPYFNIYMSAEIVTEIAGARNSSTLTVLLLVTIIGNFAISIISGGLSLKLSHKTTILNQKEDVLFNNKTLTLDYDNLEIPEVRQLRRKIVESARINWHGKELLISSINDLAYNVVNIIFALYLFAEMLVLIISLAFSWVTILFVGLLMVLISLNVWMNFITTKKMSKISNDASEAMIDENRIDDAMDSYNMGKDVRLYRQDKLIMGINEYAFNLHKKSFRKMYSANFKSQILLSVLSFLLQAITYIFVCIYAVKDVFGIGSIIKYIGFIQRLITAVIALFDISANIKYNTQFIEDYLAFFDIQQKMQQGTLHLEKQGEGKCEIEFKNVSFKYPGTEKYALRNLSFKFKTAERLAVVGMNGSGKTTMIKLLCRLYDPTEGEITMDGIDIKKYCYDEYMRIFSVVFQDFKLFSFSLGQNVASGVEFDKVQAEQCLNVAGFSERLSSMSKGLDTCLYKDFEEDGIEVSGGEAQKIALARALYKDAPFIILDEPTAALDPIAEYEIYSKFNDIVGEKTAIYISHRLSSCRFCDDIAVFHEGRLVQRGSNDILLADENGKYFELWHAQAQYYAEKGE